MSSYVREIQVWPNRETCPVHGIKFKKHGKYWKCPQYRDCGSTIGSRPLAGHKTTMWIRQTKKGKAWVKEQQELAVTKWWGEWPSYFAAACFVAASGMPVGAP